MLMRHKSGFMSSIQRASSFVAPAISSRVTLPLAQVTVQIDPVMGPAIDVTQELCDELRKIHIDVSFLEELLKGGKPVVIEPSLYYRIMRNAVHLMGQRSGWSTLILNRGYCELIRNATWSPWAAQRLFIFPNTDRTSFCSYTFVFKEIGTNSLKVTPYNREGKPEKSFSISVAVLPPLEKLPSMDFFPEWAQQQARTAAESIQNLNTREQVQIILAEGIMEREKFIQADVAPRPSPTSCGDSLVSIHGSVSLLSTPSGASPSESPRKETEESL